MKNIKALRTDQQTLEQLKGLLEVYEEVAAAKMQKIRAEILTSRAFYEGLARLSEEVGADFQGVSQQRNNRAVAVFISANAGLYGSILEEMFTKFVAFVSSNPVDAVVVGSWGADMMRTHAPQLAYRYENIGDDSVDIESLGRLMGSLARYGKIIMFYGKFNSIVNQAPASEIISGQMLPVTSKRELAARQFDFIYEPSIPEISEVFSTEIMASLFEQSLRESQLAKHASRLMHLDSAMDKIDEETKTVYAQRKKLTKRLMDKRQLAATTNALIRQTR